MCCTISSKCSVIEMRFCQMNTLLFPCSARFLLEKYVKHSRGSTGHWTLFHCSEANEWARIFISLAIVLGCAHDHERWMRWSSMIVCIVLLLSCVVLCWVGAAVYFLGASIIYFYSAWLSVPAVKRRDTYSHQSTFTAAQFLLRSILCIASLSLS